MVARRDPPTPIVRPTHLARGAAGAVLVAVAAPAALAVITWVGALVRHRSDGLDPSDESYYLLSALRPAASTGTNTDFGFYLRPLLDLGGSVGGFRTVGGLLLVLAAGGAAWSIVRWLPGRPRGVAAAVPFAALALPILAVTLTHYGLWITTPGYNLLDLTLVLVAAGLLVTLVRPRAGQDDDTRAERGRAAAALGVVLVVGLAVKISTFAVVALLAVLAAAITHGRRALGWAGPAAVGGIAGLTLHWLVFAGSPVADIRRFARGVEAFRLLGSHPAEKVWETDFLRDTVVPWFTLLAIGAVVLAVAWRRVTDPRVRLLLTGVGAAATMLPLLTSAPKGGAASLAAGSGWWWVRLTALALLWTTAAAPRGIERRLLAVGPLVALLAPAATAGSNNGVVRQIAMMAGPLAVAVAVQATMAVADRRGWAAVGAVVPAAVFSLVASLTSLSIAGDAVETPYRLGIALDDPMVTVHLADVGSVSVPPATADYVETLQALAPSIDPAALGCFVDLTGGTPISALALGARPAAFPWMAGAYPGSAESAAYLLDRASCLDGPVALLESPDGARAIERPPVLADRSFSFVGEVEFRGYLEERQVLSVSSQPTA